MVIRCTVESVTGSAVDNTDPDNPVVDSPDMSVANSTMSTGIIFGGVLSINADPTKIDISAGAGYVVDDTVVPATLVYVEWDAFTAVTLTDLATEDSTDIAINAAGAVVQQRFYTNTELRSNIFLGGVDHAGGVVNNTFSVQVPSFAPALSVRDLARAVGDLNLSGNVFGAASTNLTIAKTLGQSFSFGRNTATNKDNPHIISQIAVSPVTFNYIYQDGSGGTTVTAPTSNVNPLNYDDGTGTLATVGTNDFAFQNILLFPNSNKVFIQYGTVTYNRLDDAINGLATTIFPPLVGFTSAMRRGVLIVKRGTTNLATATDARFFAADKYGSIAGSVGTGVAPDLTVYVPYTGATGNVDLGANSLTSPLIIGGTSTTADLVLRTTSGVGTTGSDMIFQGGNNGATEFARFLNNGNFGIGGISSPQGILSMPNMNIYQVSRTMPNTVGDAVDIGSFNNTQGAGNYEVWITVANAGFSTTKRYFFTTTFGGTAGAWQKVFPISSTSFATSDIDLEINTSSFTTSLRIRRTINTSSSSGTAEISIIHQGVELDTFTPSTASASVSAPTVNYAGNKAEGFNTNFLGIGNTDNAIYTLNNTNGFSSLVTGINSGIGSGATQYTSLRIGSGANNWSGGGDIGNQQSLDFVHPSFGLSSGGYGETTGGRLGTIKEDTWVGTGSASMAFSVLRSGTLTEAVRIKANGYVGVGTPSPTFRIDSHLAGVGSTYQARFYNPTAGVGNTAGFALATAGGWEIRFRTNQNNGWFEITDSGDNIQHRWNGKNQVLSSIGKLEWSNVANFESGGVDVWLDRLSAGVLRTNGSHTITATMTAVNSVSTTKSNALKGMFGSTSSVPSAVLQSLSTPADIGSYSLTSWNATGYPISAFFKTPTSNGGSSPVTAEPALVLGREGVAGQAFANFAEFKIRRWEHSGTNARTAMDIALTHAGGDAAGTNIMSLFSSGDVEIHSNAGGLILKSPDNTRWRVTVDNSGNLVTTSL